MQSLFVFTITINIILFSSCRNGNNKIISNNYETKKSAPNFINEIALPKGFERITTKDSSFQQFLQNFALKKDNTIYYYNNAKKERQDLHEAILDLSVGNRNLQQCADATIRLRAEYFFRKKEYRNIEFRSTSTTYNFQEFINNHLPVQDTNVLFSEYLETVFINCGTYNLFEALKPIKNKLDIKIGDVFVKPGSPGHAMIVVDVATSTKKEKIFLLAQSFMPAQSVHIVKNLNNDVKSPWYSVDTAQKLITPGYTFDWNDLKTWY